MRCNLDHVKPFNANDKVCIIDDALFLSVTSLRLDSSGSLLFFGEKKNKNRFSKFSATIFASFLFHSFAILALFLPAVLFANVSELPAIQVEILAETADRSEEKIADVAPIIEEAKTDEPKSIEPVQAIQNPIQLASVPSESSDEIIRPANIKIEPKQFFKIELPKIALKLLPSEIEPKKPNLADIRRKKQKSEAQIARNELADERREKAREQRLAAKKLANSKRAVRNQESSENRNSGKAIAENTMSQSAYASLVSAQINAHKTYPSLAREQGISGVVNIAFKIGRAGRVHSAIVTKSSGSSVLDSSAKQAVLAIALPPPPDGQFSSSVPIRYGLR